MKVTCRVIAALNPLDIGYYLLLIFRSESVSRYESLGRYDHHKSLRVITSLYDFLRFFDGHSRYFRLTYTKSAQEYMNE